HVVAGPGDAIAGALPVAGAALHLAVINADLHEGAGAHFRPVQAERDLIVAVGLAGDRQREVVEDTFVEAMHHGKPVGGGKIDARLPFLGRAFLAADGRNLELHARSPRGSSGIHFRPVGVVAPRRQRPSPATAAMSREQNETAALANPQGSAKLAGSG